MIMKLFVFVSVFCALFCACEFSNDENKPVIDPPCLNVVVSALSAGKIELQWESGVKGAWYNVAVRKNGAPVADMPDGSVAFQSEQAEISYVDGYLEPGSTYNIEVKAQSYLISDEVLGRGSIDVTIPALPKELIGEWSNELGQQYHFKTNGALLVSGQPSNEMNWTVDNDCIAITTRIVSGKQIETYKYKLSENKRTLSLISANNVKTILKRK